ncbi:MAG: hypothetical protein NZ930_04875 [Candidatus Bipolaricaulota bacterium]|nr:hypothetical protein [Candidatus Bipolaricaulota bacterium]MDW8030361.1 hypothetical protein [Candidatus Bipolaricaulota bacterium]
MNQIYRGLICGICVLALVASLGQIASAQTVLGRFISELSFNNVSPYFLNAEFRVLSRISVAQAAFATDTKFDVSSTPLRWQKFIASVEINPLSARNRLTFTNGFTFDRNELVVALSFGGISLGVELILENQSPSLEVGLVVEAAVKTLWFTVANYAGFGVNRVVEDLDLDQLPIANEPFGFDPRIVKLDTFSEREPDRVVTAPFVFTEDIVAVEFYALDVASFSVLGLLTPSGFKKLIPGVAIKVFVPTADLTLRLTLSSTFEFPGAVLTFWPFELSVRWSFLQWRSITLLADPPPPGPPNGAFSFRKQVFQTLFELAFFRAFTEICFGPDCPGGSGLEWRLGAELRFLFGGL